MKEDLREQNIWTAAALRHTPRARVTLPQITSHEQL
jgi:hypothetical protein